MLITVVFAILAAALSPGPQAHATVLEKFSILTAVQPVDGGGFVAVGPLQEGISQDDQKSAFVVIGQDGAPLGDVIPLPAPGDATYAQISGLTRTATGDFIGVGWIKGGEGSTASQPDAWMIRFTVEGTIVWNERYRQKVDERLYSVRRLAGGGYLGVGRSQVSPSGGEASAGFAVWFDENGSVQRSSRFADQCLLRCAFQHVVELINGNLVFTGWITTADARDNIWLVVSDSSGGVVSSLDTMGGSGNDIGWSIDVADNNVVVAGRVRDDANHSFGFYASSNDGFSFNIMPEAGGELRAVHAMPTGGFVVAGGTAGSEEDGGRAFYAFVDAEGSTGPGEETLPSGYDRAAYRELAVGDDGSVAFVGHAGVDRSDGPFHGIVSVVSTRSTCGGESGTVQSIDPSPGTQASGCAGSDPAQFTISYGPGGTGFLIRPTLGAVDVLLMAAGGVVDSSLNQGGVPELVEVPVGATDLVLEVSAESGLAAFSVEAIELPQPFGPPADQFANPFGSAVLESALAVLGFDPQAFLIPGRVSLNDSGSTRRAVQTFQAARSFPATGQLTTDEYWRLLSDASLAVEPRAAEAAAQARTVAENRPASTFEKSENYWQTPDTTVVAFQGGLQDGRVWGIGTFESGAVFEGRWDVTATRVDANSKPDIGVLTTPLGCTVWLEQLRDRTVAGGGGGVPPSLVVMRRGSGPVYRGYLAGPNIWTGFYEFEGWFEACFGSADENGGAL